MRYLIFLILSISLPIACSNARQSSVATERVNLSSLAIEDVTTIPLGKVVLATRQTVLVRDGKIAEIGPVWRVRAPSDAMRVDGRGKFLIPALAEMHAHIPGDQATDQEIERILFLYAANGIGTIRGTLGHPRHIRLRERVARGELVSPMIYISGPSFSGNNTPTAAAAVKLVTQQKEAGYDFLKIHPGLTRDVFNALVATADKVGIRVAGDVPADVGLERALEARYATIDSFGGYLEALARDGAPPSQGFGVNLVAWIDESRITALMDKTKKAGTHIVPTQIVLENWYGPEDPEAMAKWPEMRYADRNQVAQWIEQKRKMTTGLSLDQRQRFIAIRRKLIKALHDADIPILLGSGASQPWNVPGFSIHRELATYVTAGLMPHEALVAGTRNVAAALGTLDRAGTIAAGKRADLVLLDANPLVDISNTMKIAGVVLGGRWLPKREIDRRLNEGTSPDIRGGAIWKKQPPTQSAGRFQ